MTGVFSINRVFLPISHITSLLPFSTYVHGNRTTVLYTNTTIIHGPAGDLGTVSSME